MLVDFRLLLDGIIVLLLILTIAYAAILNRRLGRLRGGRAELEAASRGFAEAALRLDSNLKGLKATAEGAGGILQKRIDRASALSQQLGELTDRAQDAARTAKPMRKINMLKPRVEPEVAPAAQSAVAPLVLNEVADSQEPAPTPRATRRPPPAEPEPSGASDLAELLAALEELK